MPDIIHAHFAYPAGLAGVHLGAKWGVPAVLTLHGDDTNVHPLRSARALARFRSAVRRAGEVVAVSQALARQAESISGRLPKVLPIGVDLKKFEALPSRIEARSRLGLPTHAPIVLYVGRLLETKGVRELVAGIAGLGDLQPVALFVGSGALAGEVSSAPFCRCVGVQANEQIPLFMRAADMLALPSYSEGMPTVLVEAGAAGLPVISTGVGGIPELLAGGRGYLIPVKSVEALRGAIKRVLTSPGEAAGYAERLGAMVRARYDARKNAQDLLEVFQGLSAKTAPPAPGSSWRHN